MYVRRSTGIRYSWRTHYQEAIFGKGNSRITSDALVQEYRKWESTLELMIYTSMIHQRACAVERFPVRDLGLDTNS